MAEGLIINDTAYSGEAAELMITRAVVEMDTVNKKAIYILDGIKKEYRIPRIEVSNFVQARQATPTSQGEVVVDGNLLAPMDYMVYIEFNPRDFEQHWFAYQLSDELLDRTMPQTAENFMIYQLMKRLNEFNEKQIWRGRLAYAPTAGGLDPTSVGAPATDAQYQYFDGLEVKLLNDANTIFAPSPAPLTSGNIIAAIEGCYELVPEALVAKYGEEGLRFLVSISTKRIYDSALTTLTFKDTQNTEMSVPKFKGYNLDSLAGLSDNTIVVCIATPDINSNLWLGLNSKDDEQTVMLRQLQNNSELYFVKALLKADVNFGFSDQIVLYTTLTA